MALGLRRSLVRTDKGGEDAVLPAEQLLWLVKLKDGATFQDNHQVCTQDGVHAVLGGRRGLSGWWGEGGAAEGVPPAVRRRRPVNGMSHLWGGCDPKPLMTPSPLTKSQLCPHLWAPRLRDRLTAQPPLWRQYSSLAPGALGQGRALESADGEGDLREVRV